MGNKHKRIFEALYEKPERNDILWDDFLALVIYLGGTVKKGGGSSHGVKLNGEYSVFHRPHPGNEIYSSDLKRIRKFLSNAGISKVE